MKLTLNQIQSVTKGAVRVEEKNDTIQFYRFSKEQEELYRLRDSELYQKTFSSAGVRLEFVTDSTHLGLSVSVSPGCSRIFFNIEIFANGKKVGELGSLSANSGAFSGAFSLDEGEKTVCVYLPWSVQLRLNELTLDDGASLRPVKKKRKMLLYGDSITHGYDAIHPSRSYASKLTDALDAEGFNKAIGAEVFWRALAETSDEIAPDIITVAYGTNDWSKQTKEDFEAECAAFYEALSRRNPQAKIFAITPIWRADRDRVTKVGAFEDVATYIRKVTASLPNVTVIDGVSLLPHDTTLFSDVYLHPNDKGFGYYFENLYREIQKYL